MCKRPVGHASARKHGLCRKTSKPRAPCLQDALWHARFSMTFGACDLDACRGCWKERFTQVSAMLGDGDHRIVHWYGRA